MNNDPECNVPQKPLIYLACPYRHAESDIQKLRFKMVSKVAGQLAAAGNLIYSPITHTAPMAHEARISASYDQWKELDEFYLSRCDIVIVLQLADWQRSEGIKDELAFANDLNKPIIYLPPSINTNVIRRGDVPTSSH